MPEMKQQQAKYFRGDEVKSFREKPASAPLADAKPGN